MGILLDLFVDRLGFRVLRRTKRSAWLRQGGATVDLQLIGVESSESTEDRRFSQISFITSTPQADLEQIAEWLEGRGVRSGVFAYSADEFYLDAPELFVGCVMEAMTPEMAEYGDLPAHGPSGREAKGDA